MNIKKEVKIIFAIVLLLFLLSFFNGANELLTGEASTIGRITNELRENEYLFYVNQGRWVEDKFVKLVDVTENKEIILSVNDNKASIGDKIILNNELQIEKITAIREKEYGRSFAVLNIIKVEQDKKIECRDSDGGYNIYVKGKCIDEYYSDLGVEDFCDNQYLKEYSCKYDSYSKKTICMKDIVECSKCIEGKCIETIKAY